MKKILVLFALIPFFVFSQSKIVTGTVNDENNLPLVGVNITVDNSNIGALTDFDGNYMRKAIRFLLLWSTGIYGLLFWYGMVLANFAYISYLLFIPKTSNNSYYSFLYYQ